MYDQQTRKSVWLLLVNSNAFILLFHIKMEKLEAIQEVVLGILRNDISSIAGKLEELGKDSINKEEVIQTIEGLNDTFTKLLEESIDELQKKYQIICGTSTQ